MSDQTTDLLEKQIEIGRNKNIRTITVHEATYIMGLRRGQLIGEFLTNPHKDPLVQAGRVNLYSALAACSSGDVPTDAEFVVLREADVDAWLSAAKELNPKWFEWLDMASKALSEIEQTALKKKDRPRHAKSTKRS